MDALPYSFNSSKSNTRIITSEHSGVKRMEYSGDVPTPFVGTHYLPRVTPSIAIFPILGKSLPQKFECIFPEQETAKYISINVQEYGGHPDLDYFKIIDIDENGMPIYMEEIKEKNEVKFYRKPYLYTGGENKDKKVYINKNEIKGEWLNDSE